jgi:hypothetical protein
MYEGQAEENGEDEEDEDDAHDEKSLVSALRSSASLSIRIRVFFVFAFVLSFAFDLFLSASGEGVGALRDRPVVPAGPNAGAVLDFELSRAMEEELLVRAHVCRITLLHVGRFEDEDDEDKFVEDDSCEATTSWSLLSFFLPPCPSAAVDSSSIDCVSV